MIYLSVLFNFIALLALLGIFWFVPYTWPLLITAIGFSLFADYCKDVARKQERHVNRV